MTGYGGWVWLPLLTQAPRQTSIKVLLFEPKNCVHRCRAVICLPHVYIYHMLPLCLLRIYYTLPLCLLRTVEDLPPRRDLILQHLVVVDIRAQDIWREGQDLLHPDGDTGVDVLLRARWIHNLLCTV